MDRQDEGKVPEVHQPEAELDSTVSTDKLSRDESLDIPDVGLEVEIAELAAAADAVSFTEDAVGQEAGAKCSTPNTSYENVLRWWEKKEPIAQNTDDNERRSAYTSISFLL